MHYRTSKARGQLGLRTSEELALSDTSRLIIGVKRLVVLMCENSVSRAFFLSRLQHVRVSYASFVGKKHHCVREMDFSFVHNTHDIQIV